jgi:Fe-S-cluster formation regulator IscX/YfhJ
MSEQEKRSYWWCQNCKAEVDPRSVTYAELHQLCGHPVTVIEPTDTAPAPVNAELLEACRELVRAVNCDQEPSPAIERAEAAIANATKGG